MYSSSSSLYSSSYSTTEKRLPNKHIVRVSDSYENDNGVTQSSHDAFDIDPLGKTSTIPYEKGLQLLSDRDWEDWSLLKNQNPIKNESSVPFPSINDGVIQEPTPWTCPICDSDESAAETDGCTSNRVLWLQCGHKFHTCCILPWLQQGKGCPICRSEYTGFVVERPNSNFEGKGKRKQITKRVKQEKRGEQRKRYRKRQSSKRSCT